MFTIRIVRFLLRIILPLFARIEIEGSEKIPSSGKLVVAANHLGRLDAFLVFYTMPRDDIILIIAEKYRNHPLFAFLSRLVNGIFVDRFNPDIHAVREVLRRLNQGQALVIAPEGTRSKTEALLPGQPGVVYFASKSGAPVVPVAVTGTEDRLVRQNLKRLRRVHIRLRVGDPFTLAPLSRGAREESLQAATDEIMCHIAALLPERYRGVYADHPRLKELLAQSDHAAA